MKFHAEDGAHSGLDHFRIEYIYSVRRCENSIDSEPVRHPENGAEIARITDGIESKIQAGPT